MPFSPQSIPLVGVVTPFLLVAFIAVGVRLHIRVTLLKNPGADDWLCLGAICCATGTFLANMVGVAIGFGNPILSMSPENRLMTMKTIWISPPLWGLSSALIKMSIVSSYLRIWSGRRFKILCYTLLALLSLFGLTLFFGGIFACVPIALSWTPPSPDSRDPRQCMDLPLFMFITSTLNTAADLVIIAIPVPLVRRLQIAKKQQIALIGVFTIGAVVCVASIMRLVSIYRLGPMDDPSVSGIRLGLWSGVESNLAITCACLPTLRPVLVRLFPKLLNATANSSQSWHRSALGRRWTGRTTHDENGAYRMHELPSDDFGRDDSKLVGDNVELGRIRVSQVFRVDVESIPASSHMDNQHRSYLDID
ncbi:hypothetical protein F4776DRAFT_582662 [Hypoxylon sp. NC0597]|nr:hypothetical protein F4776DRAFT_582662 [Hypoxylon sp. NC0597]